MFFVGDKGVRDAAHKLIDVTRQFDLPLPPPGEPALVSFDGYHNLHNAHLDESRSRTRRLLCQAKYSPRASKEGALARPS